jgi:phosphatidate cytidylyltransferase
VDEGDEYESERDPFADPVTERVRIIGAEPVGKAAPKAPSPGLPTKNTATAAGPAAGAAAYPDDDIGSGNPVSEPLFGFDSEDAAESWATPETGDLGPRASIPAWLDDRGSSDEPVISTEMPHWTDPPTGQVPAVLDRRSDVDAGQGSASATGDAGPAWREHRHEWDESAFDPSLLADETTRVGALDEVPLEERQPWEFDDLGTPPGGTSLSWASSTGAPGTAHAGDMAEGTLGASPPRITPSPVDPDDGISESPLSRRGSGSNGVPSISSSPLRASSDPLSPAAIPGARRHKANHRPVSAEGPGGGRNVPLSIATGLVFAAVAVACFEIGSVATVVLTTVVVVLAAAEAYAGFRKAGSHPATLLGLVATAAVMVTAYAKGVAALPLVLVLLVVTSMVWYLVGAERGSPVAGISATVLGFAWVGLLGSYAGLLLAPSQYPNRHGIAFLFGAVVATVAADVGALVIGGWRGRHPLAPQVSPHKTWEGLIGGTVFAIVASAAITGQVYPWTPGKAAILGVVVAVVAPIGDLCESLLKRDLGLKDMGSILPGHGGILDRVDAMLFVLPATYYLVRVLHLG